MGFNFNLSFGNPAIQAEKDTSGNWFYSFLDYFKSNKGFKNDHEKLKTVISSPATLKALAFSADVAKMAQINQYSEDDTIKEKNVLQSIGKPNDWQTWGDLTWDIDFWLNLGNAYVYEQNGIIYCLNALGIEIDKEKQKQFEQLTFSKYGTQTKRNAIKGTFKYRHNLNNSNEQVLELKNLYILSDLSNSLTGSWLKSNSRIDALYQVIINSQGALKSKDINLEFSQKFLLSGSHDVTNPTSQIMKNSEKQSIEKSLRGSRQIHVSKSKLDLNHLVSDLNKLKLDDAYLHDLAVIGNMYGMNRDVLDMATKGSTYENREKSFGAYIDYSKMPHVTQIVELYSDLLGIEGLKPTYEHLPFNQVFRKEMAETNKVELESLKIAKELGLEQAIIDDKLNQLYK